MVNKKYNTLNIATLAVGFLLVVFLNFNKIITEIEGGSGEIVFGFFICILVAFYAIYLGFSKKEITKLGKAAFWFFSIFVNCIFGILVLIKIGSESTGVWKIIAGLNIFIIIIFLIRIYMKKITVELNIIKTNKTILSVSFILVIIATTISTAILQEPWYHTMSLVLLMSNVLGQIPHQIKLFNTK